MLLQSESLLVRESLLKHESLLLREKLTNEDARSFYFDLDAVSDGTGTQSSPYNSLKYLNNPDATVGVNGYNGIIPEDNDTYYIKGTGRGTRLAFDFSSGGSHASVQASNVTVRGWEGEEKWHLTPGQEIPIWNKTATYTNIYEFDMSVFTGLPGTPSVYQVAYDYGAFETPATNGKLTPASVWMVAQTFTTNLATTLTNMDAVAGRFYWDAASTKLYIHAPSSADPNAATYPVIAYYYDTTLTTTSFLSVRSPSIAEGCSGWTVSDVIVSGYTTDARSIEVLDSDNFTLRDFQVWFAGDDAVAFAGSGARNAHIYNGFIAGQNARSGAITADTGIVFYTDSASVRLSGNVAEDIEFHYFTTKTTAGADLHAPAGSVMATHCANLAEGQEIRGVVWRNNKYYGYGVHSNPVRINSGRLPTDIYDPDTYGVVFEDCRFYECVNFNSRADAGTGTEGEQVAFVRCYTYSTSTSGSQQINLGAGCTWYSEFSVWEFGSATTNNISAQQGLGNSRKHRWISRNNLYINATSTAAIGIFTVSGSAATDGAQFHIHKDVYHRSATASGRWFRAGTGAELYNISGSSAQLYTWFNGITVPLFGYAPADTNAEYIALYDPAAVCLLSINPDLELSSDPTVVHEYVPISGGDITTRTAPGSTTTKIGIDGVADSGKWGPYQGTY